MKVLHVVEAFGGGVQSALVHFITSAPFASHVVVARERAGEGTTEVSGATVELHVGGHLQFARATIRAIRHHEPDVVHFHSSKAGALRPFAGRRVHRAYSPHCYSYERRDVSQLKRAVFWSAEAALAKFTDVVIAVSPHEANLARKLRSSAHAVTVSNLPPVDSVNPSAPSHGGIVTVGRIAPQKDPELYAEIARSVSSQREIVWIGDGDPDARALLEDSGVRVTGWLDSSGVQRELQRASLYLHTAAWEASPMSIAQALAAGKPVICRDLATLESLGYFIGGNDATSLAASVEAYFNDASFRSKVDQSAADAIAYNRQIDTTAALSHAYTSRTHLRGPDD